MTPSHVHYQPFAGKRETLNVLGPQTFVQFVGTIVQISKGLWGCWMLEAAGYHLLSQW